MATLILASASPRRRELLTCLGVPFEVVATDGETSKKPVPASVLAALPSFPLPIEHHPALLAWRKAEVVVREGKVRAPAIILAADTIAVIGEHILNKPRDAEHARAMLSQLSGRTHTVYTGLCLIQVPHDPRSAHQGGEQEPDPQSAHQGEEREPDPHHVPLRFDLVATDVHMRPLSEETIAAYVATGEPLDKAGAYGIQGLGGHLVSRIEGSYTSVVGLPLLATYRLLREAGLTGLVDPVQAFDAWLSQQRKEPWPFPPTFP